MWITTLITDRCTTAISMEKIVSCALKSEADIYVNFSGESNEFVKIYNYKTFSINMGEQSVFVFPPHVKEIREYYINEKANGTPEEEITAYIASWLSRINEKLFNTFLGYSTAGITDGWITKAVGVDGIDINVELLAKQIRLADLVKEEPPKAESAESETPKAEKEDKS